VPPQLLWRIGNFPDPAAVNGIISGTWNALTRGHSRFSTDESAFSLLPLGIHRQAGFGKKKWRRSASNETKAYRDELRAEFLGTGISGHRQWLVRELWPSRLFWRKRGARAAGKYHCGLARPGLR